MKRWLIAIVLVLFLFSNGYAEMKEDGFDVITLYSATKAFDLKDKKLVPLLEFIKSKFQQNSSGSYTDGDIEYEETTYLDKNENSVKIATQKNTKTSVGTTTIKVIGPEEVVNSIRNKAK